MEAQYIRGGAACNVDQTADTMNKNAEVIMCFNRRHELSSFLPIHIRNSQRNSLFASPPQSTIKRCGLSTGSLELSMWQIGGYIKIAIALLTAIITSAKQIYFAFAEDQVSCTTKRRKNRYIHNVYFNFFLV